MSDFEARKKELIELIDDIKIDGGPYPEMKRVRKAGSKRARKRYGRRKHL